MKSVVYLTSATTIIVLITAMVCSMGGNTSSSTSKINETRILLSNVINESYEPKTIDNNEKEAEEQLPEIVEEPITQEIVPEETLEEKLAKQDHPYYLKVNRTHNVINVYIKDDEGNYTIPYKAILCSTGKATPLAGKKVQLPTYRNRWGGLMGGVYGQYAVQITGNILFHSVPYTAKRHNALEYWEYDKLGTKCSAGCIRLTTIDAKWIYENVPTGSWVEFYEDDNPGPFGKPTAMKISDNVNLRGWDPTDPDENNPWIKYLEELNNTSASTDELINIEDTNDYDAIMVYDDYEDFNEYEVIGIN